MHVYIYVHIYGKGRGGVLSFRGFSSSDLIGIVGHREAWVSESFKEETVSVEPS